MQAGYWYPLEEQGVQISFVEPSVANHPMIAVSFAFESFEAATRQALLQLEEDEEPSLAAAVAFGITQKALQKIFVALACHQLAVVAAAVAAAQLHLLSRELWPAIHLIHFRMPAYPVPPWLMKNGDGSC